MTHQPKFTHLNGKGTFTSGNHRIDTDFTVQRQLTHTLFIIQGDNPTKAFFHQFSNSEFWSLSGQLNDGRPILADQLILTKVEGIVGYAELTPLAGVVIGGSSPSPPVEVRYPLVGMFNGKFSVEDSGWTIQVLDSDENASLAERQSKSWRVPMEGLTLRLTKTQTTLDEYHEKAREIMLLLSLAVGNGVTSNRQIADWGIQGTMEVWRQMIGDEIGPGPIVPDFRLGQFLKQVLPVWKQWKSDKKSEARLAITYINLSGTGYLDTRLFQISQAWEFLATSWMLKGKLSDPEQNLRQKIKHTYRQWKNAHPEADPKGYWGSRITFSFKWPQTRKQIESLVESRRVDISKIGLDFELMKIARDGIAHSGKMPPEMASGQHDTYQLLRAAQFGLQLVLLVELEYSGLVVTVKEGWKSYVKIDSFLMEVNNQ